jgi:hypothetical protein
MGCQKKKRTHEDPSVEEKYGHMKVQEKKRIYSHLPNKGEKVS